MSKTSAMLLLGVVMWGYAGVGAWTVASALRSGGLRTVLRRGGALTVTRADHPRRYWCFIALVLAVSAVCASIGFEELIALF